MRKKKSKINEERIIFSIIKSDLALILTLFRRGHYASKDLTLIEEQDVRRVFEHLMDAHQGSKEL
jgi:hypothetical protein